MVRSPSSKPSVGRCVKVLLVHLVVCRGVAEAACAGCPHAPPCLARQLYDTVPTGGVLLRLRCPACLAAAG